MSIENYFGSVIHTRTREDALADGDLVDVGHMAREARFRIPVALTRAAWAEAVEWDDERPEPQDEDRGRQWNDPELIELALHIGPGDEGESVITIMLPRED